MHQQHNYNKYYTYVQREGLALTKKELSQLYWLNREIEEQQRRLDELECFAEEGK